MKRAIKLFVAIVVTIGAIRVNASDSALKVNVVGEKVFLVEVTNVQGEATSYFKDDLGQVLYRKKSKDAKVRFSFDLSKLENGEYTLAVKDDHKIQTLPVIVSDEGIQINESQLEKTFLPSLVQNDEEVIVKLIADKENDLFVNIRTNDGKLLLQDKVEGKQGLIGKKYQFTPGKYTVTMMSDDFAKTSTINIK